LADTPYWTNRDVVRLRTAPRSVIVLGGGPVGLVLAQVLARFGADTSVVEAAPRLLPGGEPEASESITGVLEGEGIAVHAGDAADRVRYDGARFEVALGSGTTLTGEHLLVATGRVTDLAALGVGAVGLNESARTIRV